LPARSFAAAPKEFFAIAFDYTVSGTGGSPPRAIKVTKVSVDLSNVPIYAATRDRSKEDLRAQLEELVRNFEGDAAGNRALIRDILDNDREFFYSTALGVLKTSADSRGGQYLLALLVANGLLARALCEPTLTRQEAMNLARQAVRVDPLVDAALARILADSAVGQGETVQDPARLMEILAEIADPARVLPSLMRLLRHPNPYLRSKVVKMIGRGSRSAKWVKGKLNETDPRVRANAIEALWGVDSPDARALLHFATNDPNNRVLGNALLGLYYIGECSVLDDIVELSTHESASFRATAAWVMGETGDVRFSDHVRHLLLQTDALVRKKALVALSRIKQTATAATDRPKCHIAARVLTAARSTALRRVTVAIASEGAREQRVAPIQFIMSEGKRYVTSYKVNERPEPEAMSVIFVIPRTAEEDFRPFAEGALQCLQWKRPSDLWCVLPYLESGDPGLAAPAQEIGAPQFTARADAIEDLFLAPARRVDCTDLWTAIYRATRADSGASRGKRHVIVFSRSPESRVAGHGVISNVQAGRTNIQVVSTAENPEIAEFCRRTHTAFAPARPEEVPNLIRQAYLGLLARYEIVYQPVDPEAPELRVRVQSGGCCGETSAPIPRDSST
jgi:HEAT repeat protein